MSIKFVLSTIISYVHTFLIDLIGGVVVHDLWDTSVI